MVAASDLECRPAIPSIIRLGAQSGKLLLRGCSNLGQVFVRSTASEEKDKLGLLLR